MMLTIIVCGMAVWPASFAVAAETSSLQLRAKSQGIGWMVSAFATAVSGIALPYVFNPDSGNLRGKVGFTYVVSCIAGVAISWYLIPEMKGRSIGDIDCSKFIPFVPSGSRLLTYDSVFEMKVPARSFRDYKVEREDAESRKPEV